MAEMYGKQEGCSHGRGGSMHLFDRATNFYGGNAIVGGGLPLAVGLALADHMRGDDIVTACFFGDGAVAEGEFHESMNLAALWRLPVLFVCENNLYAMGTALGDLGIGNRHRIARRQSYRIASEAVDGMDVVAVRGGGPSRRSMRCARPASPIFSNAGPTGLRAHSMFDAQLYRDKAEVEAWRQKEPIVRFQRLARGQSHDPSPTTDAASKPRSTPRSPRRSPSPRQEHGSRSRNSPASLTRKGPH